MDNSAVESFAVDKLKDCLRRSEFLDPNYIHIGDKEPSWDGSVYLYKNSNHSKNNIEKRLPVQVKGTKQNDLSKKMISFNVNKADLVNYFNDGGALFFVVYVKDFDNYKIYYETLSKIKLKRYLGECEKNGYDSISIYLNELPKDDISEVTDIFINFAKDYNQSIASNDYLYEDILKHGIKGYKSFHVSYHGIAYKDNPMSYFLTHPTTIYAESEGDGPDIAVAIGQLTSFGQKRNSPIFVGEKLFYESFRNEVTATEGRIFIGKSFVLVLNQKERKITFNWKIKGNLEQRITDTSFLLEFFKNRQLSVDGYNLNFSLSIEKKYDVTYYEGNLRFLKAIKELLSFLGVREELDYDLVTEQEEKVLLFLIDKVLNRKKYKHNQKETVVFQSVKIANIVFLIEIIRVSETECEIRNFFTESLRVLYKFNDDYSIAFTASQLFMLQEEQFSTLVNIDYDTIYNAVLKQKLTDCFSEYLINYTLKMLLGYDTQEKKDLELINCVIKIYDYLLNHDSKKEYYVINRIQAIRRKRQLTESEKNILLQLIDTSNNKPNKTAAFLLYGDNHQADYYYNQLSDEEKKRFDSYPISVFWKLNKKKE